MNATLKIFEEAQSKAPTLHTMAQHVVDISAMLGEACKDINKKRCSFVRGCLNENYKGLCENKESKQWLFGDDLPKSVGNMKLTNKIGHQKYHPYARKGSAKKGRQQDSQWTRYGTNNSSRGYTDSFLARGRGRLPRRGSSRPNRQTQRHYSH